MLKNILFDLDGTIINSGQGIMNTLRFSFEKEGVEVPADYILSKYIGPPLLESYEKYNNIARDSDLSQKLLADFQEYYGDTGWKQMELYPQIVETLKALKKQGMNLFIATAKPESFAVQIIEYLDLQDVFTGIYGADMTETMAKKDVIENALQHENLDPEKTLMVGDRDTDVLGAKANQVNTVGVLYGFGSKEELLNAGAIAVIEQPQELLEQVK